MSEWGKQIDDAEALVAAGNANEAFRRAFGGLELCYGQAANLRTNGDGERFMDATSQLLHSKKISRMEFDQAQHLAKARNVNVHGLGFEPSLGEAKRCVDRIRRLCSRFGKVVSDVMIKPVTTVRNTDPIGACLEVMREKGFTYLPVVDADGRVVGTLDEWALIEAIRAQEGLIDLDKPAADHMTADGLPTIAANASLDDAARQLKRARRSALLIVADGRPTGILTAFDLIR